jgi:hypothetical protein
MRVRVAGASMRTPRRLEDGRGGQRVVAFEEAFDARGAVRDGGQHDGPVRHGLVARHIQRA